MKQQSLKETFHHMLVSPKSADITDMEALIKVFPYSRALWFIKAKTEMSFPELFPKQEALAMASLMAGDSDQLYQYLYLEDVESTDQEETALEEANGHEVLPAEPLTEEADVQPEPTSDHLETASPSQPTDDRGNTFPEAEESVQGTAPSEDPEKYLPVPVQADEVTSSSEEQESIASRESTGGWPEASLPSKDDWPQPSDEPIKETLENTTTGTKVPDLAHTDGETHADNGTEEISKYDDDLMPYSFLWWLHKTRIAYAETYRPYATHKPELPKASKQEDEKDPYLDQQIKEHVFHLQSPEKKMNLKGGDTSAITFRITSKADDIIDRFIKEEPQITPPRPDKVTLENKARKSAEDASAFVSETLATIYIEQGLYHKAVDTYMKLSLKYPEKSAYFADRIEELKKKTN